MYKILLTISLLALTACDSEPPIPLKIIPGQYDGIRTQVELQGAAQEALANPVETNYKNKFVDRNQFHIVEMASERTCIVPYNCYEDLKAKATANERWMKIDCSEYIVADYQLTDTSSNVKAENGRYTALLSLASQEREQSGMQRWYCAGNSQIGIAPLDTIMAALPNFNFDIPTDTSAGTAERIFTRAENNVIRWTPAVDSGAYVAIVMHDQSQISEPEQKMRNSYLITEDDGNFTLKAEHLRQFDSGQKIVFAMYRSRIVWLKQESSLYQLTTSVSELAYGRVK